MRIQSLFLSLGLIISLVTASFVQAEAVKVDGVEALFNSGEELAGKEVVLESMVISVCKSGGKKAFLRDATDGAKRTLRVERGKSPVFEQDLRGDTLQVTGILRENRITSASVDKMEAQAREIIEREKTKGKDGDNCEHDCPENITAQRMLVLAKSYRDQLAKSEKGYLSSFWVEGISWKKVD